MYARNMRFSPFFRATQSRSGNGRFWPLVAEDGGAAWQRPVAPTPGLGLANDGPLSRHLA